MILLEFDKKSKLDKLNHKLELLKKKKKDDLEILHMLENRNRPEYKEVLKELRRIIHEEDKRIKEIEKQIEELNKK